jgi:glycosyltransferase involved in cell wall biosynthesis
MKVAWISFFPIEWLPDIPPELRNIPRFHPASWQRVLLDEFKTVAELELHIFSVRRHFPRSCEFERDGVTFQCLKVPAGMRALTLYWWETLALRRELRKIRPDLVHAWGSERGAALVASRLGYPHLVSMQGLLQWYSEHVRFRGVEWLDVQLERFGLARASVVTTESRFAVQWLKQHYPHLEVRQAEHASNWVFHQVQRQPRTRPLQFLFVGVMSLTKGTDLLLRALDQLRGELDFRLTVIGGGDEGFVAHLRQITSAQLWGRITFRQGLTQAEVAAEMATTTMVLFPTRVDTSPNSVKEAVVAGVPTVASAIGGIVDYVLPGRNGLTFPAGNLEEFVRTIRAAVAHPLFGRGQVDPATRREMQEYLSPRVMGEKFLAAYRRVVELAAK